MDKLGNRFTLAALAVLAVLLALVICGHAAENRVHFLGSGGNYQWSPTGLYLSFIRDGQLCLYVVAGDSVAIVGEAPYRQYAWLNDSGFVFSFSAKPNRDSVGVATLKYMKLRFGQDTRFDQDSVVEVDFRAAYAARLLSDGKGAVRLQTSAEGPHRVVADEARLARTASPVYGGAECEQWWGDIWLMDIEGRRIKQLTHGRKFILPSFCSPKAIVCAADETSHTIVFDSSGRQIADAGYGGGSGRFSPDCNTVFFNTEVDSETDIVGGDIYAFSLLDSSTTQLTFSPDRPELQVLPSPEGRMLAYTVHGKGGGIEIMFLNGGGR